MKKSPSKKGKRILIAAAAAEARNSEAVSALEVQPSPPESPAAESGSPELDDLLVEEESQSESELGIEQPIPIVLRHVVAQADIALLPAQPSKAQIRIWSQKVLHPDFSHDHHAFLSPDLKLLLSWKFGLYAAMNVGGGVSAGMDWFDLSKSDFCDLLPHRPHP